jgi:hypothetical protein
MSMGKIMFSTQTEIMRRQQTQAWTSSRQMILHDDKASKIFSCCAALTRNTMAN